MPSLCSIEMQWRELAVPGAPDSSGMNLGTMKRLMPLVPGGAPGVRANTRWTMLSAISCSPHVMKILVPLIDQEPSPFGSALVRSAPTSEPASGSLNTIVPVHSPLISFSR